MDFEVVGRDEGPLPGETIFAVEYLVRWRENTGGTMRGLRHQVVASLEEGGSLVCEWQRSWPPSDLTSKWRHRLGGGSEFVKRRATVLGLVNGGDDDADRLLWRAALHFEQSMWPCRLRLIGR
jgi:hypothetical protein